MWVQGFKKSLLSCKYTNPEKSALESSSALNQINDHYDNGNYEQEMDQTAADVGEGDSRCVNQHTRES